MIDWIFTYVKHPKTALVCRVAIGIGLIVAGGIKLTELSVFADNVANYHLVPDELINLFSVLLPALEVVVGLCLIAGYAMNGALFLATGMFVMFFIAVESAILRDLDIECGCFGTSDAGVIGLKNLYIDLSFLLATIPVWLTPKWLYAIDGGCCMNRDDHILENPAEVDD
jgi:uncharacterized membrane protein YphA (DoxX/SURF4 family)